MGATSCQNVSSGPAPPAPPTLPPAPPPPWPPTPLPPLLLVPPPPPQPPATTMLTSNTSFILMVFPFSPDRSARFRFNSPPPGCPAALLCAREAPPHPADAPFVRKEPQLVGHRPVLRHGQPQV